MKKNKTIITLLFFLTYCVIATANESITFTWRGASYSYVTVWGTIGKQYTIDWGDGSPLETKTDNGHPHE